MTELFIVGDGNATLDDTVHAVDQNNSIFNFTTSGHQFCKHVIMILFILCAIFQFLLSISIIILYIILANLYSIFSERNITKLSEIHHAEQIKTGGHQHVIFWIFLGLCVFLFAWLCFIFRKKIWHKIVHLCPVPKSLGNYSVRRLTQNNRTKLFTLIFYN